MRKLVVDGTNALWRWDTSSTDVHCSLSQEDDCTSVPSCIICWVYPDASELEYNVRFWSNWTAPVNYLNGSESLDYSFSYSATWASSSHEQDARTSLKTVVGDDTVSTPLLVEDSRLITKRRQTRTARSIILNGTVPAQIRDIPVAVDLTIRRPHGASVYYRMEGGTFHIIDPQLAKDSESTPAQGSSVGPAHGASIALIVGVIVGGVILIAFLTAGVLFYRRKRRGQLLEQLEPEQYVLPTTVPSPDPPSPEVPSNAEGITPYRYSNLSYTSPSSRAKSGDFHRKQDPNPFGSTFRVADHSDSASLPPAYLDESVISIPLSTPSVTASRQNLAERNRGTESVTPSRSNSPTSEPEHTEERIQLRINTPLAKWAKKHRKYIPERLERKLEDAGYVPTDDPDQLSEDEWRREWGVTIFELGRMRKLYAARQRRRGQT
ncbi:hypothetical protein PIIN_05917 [Serendipita indica DSM 11827]|uniref:Uncharacterized protein n=1 Tax=Serendipita indica (strain DSM 11827) TaxID=1109443 RepID=G4TKY9_SERID|nr:hypothetical protein PIIN_05917 [Serendipita indica DSM 11827]